MAAGPQLIPPPQGDYGGAGLLQNPTARMAEDGTISFGLFYGDPHAHLYSSLQLLPWLETTIRYSRVSNRDYSPNSDQSYKDRGLDLKIRLLEEGAYLPEVAVGVRDIGGTGLFASEYLVCNRQWWNLDFSLGVGWGRLGARGDFDNPLIEISDRFADRDTDFGKGGSPNFDTWFRGQDAALFGGVEWKTGWHGLRLKLEVEGNDYQSEALANNLEVDSRVNYGLSYPLANWVDVNFGYERGNTFTASIVSHVNLQRDKGPPKFVDPPPAPIKRRASSDPADVVTAEEERLFVKQLEDGLKAQGFELHAVDLNRDARAVHVWYAQSLFLNQARADGRVARVLTGVAPVQVETFTMIEVTGSLETHRTTMPRSELEQVASYTIGPRELGNASTLSPPGTGYRDADFHDIAAMPDFTWEMGPALRQHVGGPDNFYFGQLWWRIAGDLQFTPEFSMSSAVGINLYNNFDDLNSRPTSVLPHVRSEIVNYLKEGENNLVQLEFNQIWSPAPEWYARASAGIFEEMYGGVAAEVLYRPYDERWAVGLDVNRVRQRTFEQRFDFFDYEVTTGHLTWYHEWPWYDIRTQVSVGRYLAGDEGGTIDFSRQFANGVRAGAFATFTNVSSEDFGEGSFDKGFYLSMPLDLFFTNSSRRHSTLVFKPLTRDGGQKVDDGQPLYPLTEGGQLHNIVRGWPQVLD